MTLSSCQTAALRAKKALTNVDMSFRPRGEKNNAAFEALKEQAQTNSASNSVSAESPPHKRMKITARLLDFNPLSISDTSEEEEEPQDDAMLAKMKAHKEQIKKGGTQEKRIQKLPSGPCAVRLPPKTKAELLMEKEQEMKRERSRRSTHIFKLGHEVKQFGVYHYKYKKLEKQENLLE